MQNRAYLYLEDLVGNLFITLKQSGYHVDTLSYDLIEGYGNILGSKLIERGIIPTFVLSRDDTRVFLDNNKDLYTETFDNQIQLIQDLSINDLISKYHGYLSLPILIVILDKDTIDKTINMYESNRPMINTNKIKKLVP